MTAEPVLYPPLSVANLATEGAASPPPYRNVVISRVNESCLRLSAFEGDYRWHYHPDSDELFVVVDGTLAVDLADGTTFSSAHGTPSRFRRGWCIALVGCRER